MQQINWAQFGQKAESRQKSFEDLSMFLCCRELGISKIEAYQNQPGIETEPFVVNGKKHGFQAKFFEGAFDWEQIKKSIAGKQASPKGAIERQYPNNVFKKFELNTLYIYSNKDKTLDGRNKTKPEQLLDKLAQKYKAKIEYVTDRDIQLKLSAPSNFDLAQLFFGTGDEFGFIKNSTNPKILTFLQSSEYLDLPFEDIDKNKISDVANVILESTEKNFLIIGHPGSGKSVFMHKSLELFGGLDKENETEMRRILTNNNAVPVLVNLKNCAYDSLENILRGRKNDSKINNQELGFIYLFDGLDELSEERTDNVLLQMNELKQSSETKKIIISCRSGNLNKIKAQNYFNEITEYRITDLDESTINSYFQAKRKTSKRRKLAELKKNNQTLIKEIKDIFLIKLLWDTIEELNDSTAIIDLFSKKINLLLENPEHRKNIESLNLPNPKKDAIIKLNQDISFEFQKRFQLRFGQEDLQNLILKRFDRLDYKSADAILNYIADIFFEDSYSNQREGSRSYIYQHRRYQEFFFAQKLKTEFDKNPKILRELNVVSHRDFFEELFLRYLRKEYEKENNLAGLIELNLIDVYLGKNPGFGADEPNYVHSNEFIPSLAQQSEEVFNELIEDETLQLRDKIHFNFDAIEVFDKAQKRRFLLSEIKLFRLWFDKTENDKSEVEYKERLWFEQIESDLYCLIVIDDIEVKKIFRSMIRGNYKFLEGRHFGFGENGKEKLVKSFFRVCLREKKEELFDLIENFDEFEFIAFLDVLRTIEYLPIFVQSTSIHNKIQSFVQNFSGQLNKTNYFMLFFKRYFGFTLSEDEIKFAERQVFPMRDERKIDWRRQDIQFNYSLGSYIIDANYFAAFLAQKNIRYYDELGLYAALFRDYLDVLRKRKTIEGTARDFLSYIHSRKKSVHDGGVYLGADISRLWAHIFSRSIAKRETKLSLKNRLIKRENDIFPFGFFLELNRINPPLFQELVNESEIQVFEEHLQAWNQGYQEYVDWCFQLAQLFSGINQEKAKFYITKGINAGVLRHNWRKDSIVSYDLVTALEILWRNNWESLEKLKEFTDQIFELALRLDDITDGKETWQGPYNVVELVSNYDIEFAENLKERLIEKKLSHSFSNKVVTSVLLGKVKRGFPTQEIEQGMLELKQNYDYQGHPESDYYEQKIKVYLNIAECDLYTEEEKKEAFEKICVEYKEMRSQDLSYFLSDRDFKDEKQRLVKLSRKYRKNLDIKFDKKEETKSKPKMSEAQFVRELEKAKTKERIARLYFDLYNYRNDITISTLASWEIILNRTFEIFGNIKPFMDILKESRFPHYVFWGNNSNYYHLGVAVALRNNNMKVEVMKYIYENSGHGGFVNVMRSFEVNRDRTMCLVLFNRFLRFCDFIVN